MLVHDGHTSQPFFKASYKDFYRRYLGDIYAKFSKQIINGRRYKRKDTRIRKESCYDGACFWGEVKGDNFISYEKLSKAVGLSYDKEHIPAIEDKYLTGVDASEDAKKADKLDKEEKAVGGMWLKFTDKKYKDKNGNVREFYIAKKPVLKGVSWNDLYNANAVYGLDHQEYGYEHKIVKINGKKYVVRLLRGISNYNGTIFLFFIDFSYNDFVNKCHHSEWNRTMIPITFASRYDVSSSEMLENELKDINKTEFSNDYKTYTANYDWRRDLTLDSNYSWGQWNWMQEFLAISSKIGERETSYVIRGCGGIDHNAAHYESGDKFAPSSQYGWRPVLELIKE